MTALFNPDASGKKQRGPVSSRKHSFFDKVMWQRTLQYLACFILLPGMMLFYPVYETSAQGTVLNPTKKREM